MQKQWERRDPLKKSQQHQRHRLKSQYWRSQNRKVGANSIDQSSNLGQSHENQNSDTNIWYESPVSREKDKKCRGRLTSG